MKTTVAATALLCLLPFAVQAANSPAMVGQGPGSVAGALHYPKDAKADKKEAAVQFYCEVSRDGHARHVRILAEDPRGPFYKAVDKAIHQGRFVPAQVNGRKEAVLIGGTVIFVNSKAGPAIIVALSTADKAKAASGQNYIQPQLVMSYADLTRNMEKHLFSTSYTGGGTPNCEVLFSVNASGAITGSRVVSEVPKNAGQLMIKACEGAHFLPALSNGKPVAGEFNLPIDFRMMKEEDMITGSHLAPRQE